MTKIEKNTLQFIVFLFVISYCSPVFAIGFMPGDIFYDYLRMLDVIFIGSLFGAVVSFVAGFIGNLTGKFKVRMYVPFIFLLFAVISISIPLL